MTDTGQQGILDAGVNADGAGSAFAFMNSADLPRILDQSDVPFDPPVRAEAAASRARGCPLAFRLNPRT